MTAKTHAMFTQAHATHTTLEGLSCLFTSLKLLYFMESSRSIETIRSSKRIPLCRFEKPISNHSIEKNLNSNAEKKVFAGIEKFNRIELELDGFDIYDLCFPCCRFHH